MIRRFWFAGLAFVFLLADITSPVAAQSQQPETVTVSQAVQEAVENNLNLLAERYNLNIADARIVAALVDVTGLIIYFSVAAVILRGALL